MRRLTSAAASLGLGLALLNGCADRTSLRLVIRSNLSVPVEMDGVIIQMQSSTGATGPVRILELASNSFPQTLVVRPEQGGMSGTVTFTVQGLNDSAIVIQRVVRAPFRTGQVTDVEVELNSECLNVMCGDGVDCVRGMCEMISTRDAGMPDTGTEQPDTGRQVDAFTPMVMADAGTDANLDAFSPFDAPRDAFSPDAFTPDAFVIPDAFSPDAFRVPDAFTPPDSGIGCAGATCAGIVLISELSTGSSSSASDEFVELYNTSNRMADISNMRVYYASDSGITVTLRATIAPSTLLLPGQFYLIGSAGYVGSPDLRSTSSWTSSAGLAAGGGTLTLEDPARGIVDRVCWGSGTLCEGASVTPAHGTNGSYERKANASSTDASMSSGADATAGNRYDTGNNRTDFITRTTRNPQGLSSPVEP